MADKIVKNFDFALKDLTGKTITDENGTEFIAKVAVINALVNEGFDKETGLQKTRRFNVAMRIYEGGDIELTREEVETIKTAVGNSSFGPIVVGPIFNYLDN